MVRADMLLFTALFLLEHCCWCRGGLVVNPARAGGDPAPGRSPGPPNNGCELDGDAEEPSEALLDVGVVHRLFRTDLLVAGVEYQVVVKRIKQGAPTDFTIKSTIDDAPRGKFISGERSKCRTHVFKSQLKDSPLTVNWTLDDNDDFDRTNLTFELNYKVAAAPTVYRVMYSLPVIQDCQLRLKEEEANLSWRDFPASRGCQVWFPSHGTGHSLVVELTRLNVPCSKGFIHFSGLNVSQQHQHFRSHRQAHLCGKLEELPESDRHVYFPFSHTPPVMHTQGNPVFTLSYHLVDYCYNVTFATRNGSFELKPTGELLCTFKIYLPYGNRVALNLHIGDSTSTGTPATDAPLQHVKGGESKCEGLLTELHDGDNTWTHCTKPGDAERQIEIVSRENKVMLRVKVRSSNGGALGLRMTYRAAPVEEIVGACGFGWVSLKQFCVSAVEEAKLPWAQAEMECARRGGHLASVRSEHSQNIVNKLLLNSPGYHDHNAYWIGASDKMVEGDFRWSDSLPFSYTNWFQGWPQHGHYNRQPNDDGLSEQDCVEVRRVYSLPTASASRASGFTWNDRDCSTPNYFICERLQNDEPLEDNWPPDCNRSVELSRQQPKAVVSSPGFPRHYPDNTDCDTDITAPPGYRLVLDFEELVLENEPSCSYDYLEIWENSNVTSSINSSSARRLCGDWSSKLKLLRYVSGGSKLKLRFSSDYSHHFGGYKARVSMESATQCSDDRLHMFNNSCYLFVSYPEVTWATAQEICKGKKSQLASILSAEEERFITTNIRKSMEYRTSALYWLGGKSQAGGDFRWTDGSDMEYMGWLPGQKPPDNEKMKNVEGVRCLSIQWTPSPTPMLPSGLYWRSHRCNNHGGYVCKKPTQHSGVGINFNKTVNGSEGSLTTPHYPENYYNNLDFSVRIVGPERTRLVVKFSKIDVEAQSECLYDFVALKSGDQAHDNVKFCGTHDTDMHRFNFVSEGNEAELRFHSDYSISRSGFALTWRAVDISACPLQSLTAKEGTVTSPNYPDFILARLDCSLTVLAPLGKRVWLDFQDYNIERIESANKEAQVVVELFLGKNSQPLKPFETDNLLTEGSFLSANERLKINLRTGSRPSGKGFRATYRIITAAKEEKIINLKQNSSGTLLHLNHPDDPPLDVDFLQHFVAPLGCVISLKMFRVKLSDKECGSGVIEVYDNYYDTNGTSWKLCYDPEMEDSVVPFTPISITSFLNTLHLRQKSGSVGISLNGSLRVQLDDEFKAKLLRHKDEGVEACSPNPCLNGGKCVTKGSQSLCQCIGHFTGLFCALTKCELDPCIFGTCELTNSSYKCHCKSGYTGPTCEQKRKPCEGNPCESRGVCIERGDGFQCRCHAWWEGARCEKRMLHIPYKPLSERMFHEPFWLGLMTVFVVMAVIGLVWCAKRHFPEKIEKLLAEENDRSRSTISSLRSSSVREQLAVASGGAGAAVTPSPGPTAPRSLFGRLGIRKPSILSLTSPHASGYVPATARTFSLDDLLKPPPRRTPSPKKKRNNSTPTKKNAAEKKQILQQLISPGNNKLSRKVSLGELMQLSERHLKESAEQRQDGETKETKFDESVQSALSDPKLEKKVTFARLLNRVSAEMSSGSDLELGIMQSGRLGCVFARPSSTPPSPNVDARSPNSTSSNQGSDSFTGSDLAIPSALSSSISDLLNGRKSTRLPNGRQKPASADSILAMFRNFSSSSAGANLPPSLKVSPSTTPTASSPQDDIAGDDESSTSSIHTPVSFSSGPPESPVLHRQSTIEVPVLDPLSAHKSSSSGSNFLHPPTILLEIPSTINKCLSPIREMPTPLPSPMPSPALTPVMRRSTVSSIDDAELSDDRISIELPNISISDDDDDNMHCTQDIAIDPQAEDGLILEEAAAMQQQSKNRPPALSQSTESRQSHPLIIPMLTIQTPSPTHSRTPSLLFPGSPPPHKEQSFQFPPSKLNRKLYKDLDKPNSLDLPCVPPMITITCNMSEAESDIESISPNKGVTHLGVASAGMSYLSPFSMGARGDHNASESNLSSSGYSSMASPGPSRCGSSNPLCPSEMEDQGGPGSGTSHRRPSPLLKTNSNPTERGNIEKNTENQRRGRSDSETLSDDPLLESNDEGIGTDHIDEKIEEGDVKSAKELEVFMVSEGEATKTMLDLPLIPRLAKSVEDNMERLLPPPSVAAGKKTLQLPSIVVQCDSSGCEKLLSPMSSRSESPLSDRTTGVMRFSPQFYGRNKDLLPFTDSDGLYDFPSTDKVNVMTMTQHKKSSRRRDKKLFRNCKTPSPTKPTNPLLPHNHLDVPTKDTFYKVPPPRKLSPKRRATRSQVVSSSSSSDSINSGRDIRLTSSSPSPETIKWSSPIEWLDKKCQQKVHEGDNDDVNAAMLPKSGDASKHQKISRLRAISHQIRFLRRLELSLKRRERTISPSDSLDSGGDDESPRATSPLLQPSKSPRVEIRKSSSIGKLQTSKTKRARYKRGELLLPQEERSWKRVVITGNGHSD